MQIVSLGETGQRQTQEVEESSREGGRAISNGRWDTDYAGQLELSDSGDPPQIPVKRASELPVGHTEEEDVWTLLPISHWSGVPMRG